jgi:glycosyltransferase involved in cell wall biosynthesis
MRLLLLTNVFPSPVEPTKGVFNLGLARALAREHRVRVLSPIPWVTEWQARSKGKVVPGPHRSTLLEGVEVHYPRYYYPPKVLRGQYGWFLWRSVRGTVRRLLEAEGIDAVCGYWAHPDGEVAVRVARSVGVPAVVMVGGTDVLLLTQQPGRRRRILDVLHAADAVVSVSQDIKAKLTGFGLPADRIHVVARGVDVERFHPGDRDQARRRLGIAGGRPVLLWVGRMVPVKALDVLLDACARLRERGVPFALHLVGDGPLRRPLEARAAALGLSDSVAFVGAVAHDRLPDWYRAADFMLLPSHSEGVPNVLRESLACGTPFVATRVGGIPELAEGAANRLVPPGDPAALADALAEAVAGPRRPAPPSPSARWGESAEGLLDVVRPLIAARQGVPCERRDTVPSRGPAAPRRLSASECPE